MFFYQLGVAHLNSCFLGAYTIVSQYNGGTYTSVVVLCRTLYMYISQINYFEQCTVGVGKIIDSSMHFFC